MTSTVTSYPDIKTKTDTICKIRFEMKAIRGNGNGKFQVGIEFCNDQNNNFIHFEVNGLNGKRKKECHITGVLSKLLSRQSKNAVVHTSGRISEGIRSPSVEGGSLGSIFPFYSFYVYGNRREFRMSDVDPNGNVYSGGVNF